MSSKTGKVDASFALNWALDFRTALSHVCEKAVIAGSLRRCSRKISDVEFVVLPKATETLFGDTERTTVALDILLNDWIEKKHIAWPDKNKSNGLKYKKLYSSPVGLNIDIFIANEINFGNIMAIRTGNSDFSKLLVTKRSEGGLMPNHFKHVDGHLYEFKSAMNVLIPCRTEEAFFEALGVPFTDPEERNSYTVTRIRSGWATE
jgi:DNA polymerase/3'-5' exonuclease PolX